MLGKRFVYMTIWVARTQANEGGGTARGVVLVKVWMSYIDSRVAVAGNSSLAMTGVAAQLNIQA